MKLSGLIMLVMPSTVVYPEIKHIYETVSIDSQLHKAQSFMRSW
jgi:hypothetical protein